MHQKTDHKQVYGAGFHAGLKAAGGKMRGRDKGYLNATNAMLCWTPGTSDVLVVPWPDKDGLGKLCQMSGLACYSDVRGMDYETRKAHVFIEALHLIIRDGCEPKAVHKALRGLEEYRDGCADDMLRGI
jgi:hypothetical protein